MIVMDKDFGPTHWDQRYAASERVWSVEPNQFVEQHLSDLAPGRAVDLAAGEGRNAVWLAQRGWQVTAIDFSGVASERGRAQERSLEKTAHPVTWTVGDVLQEPLPDELDLALVSYLQLPHDEMSRLVARAHASLRPGGTFFLICHDASNLTEGVGGPQDPTVLPTAELVLDWLGEQVEVVEAGRVERTVPAGTAYDVLVRAIRT